jgi:hypothetical protein
MPRKGKVSAGGWDRAFDDPIPIPRSGELVTLRDAGQFIANLPKREHDAPEWLTAIEALMLVVERGGDTMLPCVGIMRASIEGSGALSRRRARRARGNTGSSDDARAWV